MFHYSLQYIDTVTDARQKNFTTYYMINGVTLNTVLFLDDQVSFADSENGLQHGLFTLMKIAEHYI